MIPFNGCWCNENFQGSKSKLFDWSFASIYWKLDKVEIFVSKIAFLLIKTSDVLYFRFSPSLYFVDIVINFIFPFLGLSVQMHYQGPYQRNLASSQVLSRCKKSMTSIIILLQLLLCIKVSLIFCFHEFM